MRTGPEPCEIEAIFRIVYEGLLTRTGYQLPACREKRIEVSLQPVENTETPNIGILAHRTPVEQVASALPLPSADLNLPNAFRIPRVVALLQKAIEWQALIESGECTSQTEIAARECLTRGRVTQIMGMLNLAPEIREKILSMPKAVGRSLVTERVLRPITALANQRDQLKEFHKLLQHSAASLRARPMAGAVAAETSRNAYR